MSPSLWVSFKKYIAEALKTWWLVWISGLAAIAGLVQDIWRSLVLPAGFWFGLAFLGLSITQFLAFHRVNTERKRREVHHFLTSRLSEGEALFNRDVRSDSELAQWESDFTAWVQSTGEGMRTTLSDAEVAVFRSVGGATDVEWSRRYNERHNGMLTTFMQHLENLRLLINHIPL